MRPRGRTGAAIASAAKVARALHGIWRHALLSNLGRARIDVPNEPMSPGPARCIRIVHDQSHTPGALRHIFDAHRGFTFESSHVYFFGIFPPPGNALLVTLSEARAGVFCVWARPINGAASATRKR